MTDRDRVGRVGLSAAVIANHIEEIIGEMSSVQNAKVVGAVLGFWCAEEDADHPRADGRSWKDIVRDELNR